MDDGAVASTSFEGLCQDSCLCSIFEFSVFIVLFFVFLGVYFALYFI